VIVSLIHLKGELLQKVCEVRFMRRRTKRGSSILRRMLCTNNEQLLNSIEGRTALNYRPTRGLLKYNPNQKNLLVTWDIMMQDYRQINCDAVDLITTLDADDTFWSYLSEHIAPMSAQDKINFHNT